MMVHPGHDYLLVALSLLIAGSSAYTALDLASRIRATGGWMRRCWLGAAAIAMGGGIWSMHFVAMLAMDLPGVEMVFDPRLTGLSVLLAILATGTAFFIVCSNGHSRTPLAQSALFMGTGIVAMHYTGMAAVSVPLSIQYDPAWIALSAAIAVGASAAALWLAFSGTGARMKLGAALVMGLAIAGMHYAGMAAMAFTESGPAPEDAPAMALDRGTLALAVAGATFLILFFSLMAAMFDRTVAELAAREAVALRHSEEAFRALYRRTPLPLHALDAEGRVEEASDAWLELMGYQREEVLGQPFTEFLAQVSPDGARPDLHHTLLQGDVSSLDLRLASRSGEVLDVLVSARAERGSEGEARRALCGLVDVTAHRRAEEALRQAQKMEALGQLTGGVAHDFNNVLAVVVGNLDRLRRLLAKDPLALPLADSAAAAAERGVGLTQRMLAFARQQRLEPEVIDLADLVAGMLDLLRQSLGPGFRIQVDLPHGLPPVQADPVQLELALLNLAVNGRDAMPDGGTVTISAQKAEVVSGGRLAPGKYVAVTVSDEGEGMDEATLARARDPFFTTKSLGKGTGLGLSMVHGFAEQSGGALHLTSRHGEGSAAAIWLPVTEATPSARTYPAPGLHDSAAPAAKLTVLAVDDDALVLMNTARLLEDLGHTVVEASSGAEALARLGENGTIDLLVTDQGMPEMTGLQLMAEIRNVRPELPVIVVTGYSELSGGENLVRLGKPFDARALGAAIDRAVRAAATNPEPVRSVAS